MTKKTTITCDHCGKDLSDAGAMPSFRLHLTAERVANSGAFQYAVHVTPPLLGEAHFCGFPCLVGYLDGKGQIPRPC